MHVSTSHGPSARLLWIGPLGAALALGLLGGLVLRLTGPATGLPAEARAATPKPAPNARRFLQTQGQARLEIAPDRLDVSLVLEVRRTRPMDAAKTLRKRRAALRWALLRAGVNKTRLLLTGMNIYPIYKRYPDRGIAQYAASVTVVATLWDFDKLADVAEAAATVGILRMHTRFRSSRLSALKRRARALAVKAARANARQIAGTLGIALGPVLTVNESADGSWQGWRWQQLGVDNVANAVRSVRSGATGSTLRPDAVKLHYRVSTTWALR